MNTYGPSMRNCDELLTRNGCASATQGLGSRIGVPSGLNSGSQKPGPSGGQRRNRTQTSIVPLREHGLGRGVADLDPGLLQRSVRDRAKRAVVLRLKRDVLRREEGIEDTEGRSRDRRLLRSLRVGPSHDEVRPMA